MAAEQSLDALQGMHGHGGHGGQPAPAAQPPAAPPAGPQQQQQGLPGGFPPNAQMSPAMPGAAASPTVLVLGCAVYTSSDTPRNTA